MKLKLLNDLMREYREASYWEGRKSMDLEAGQCSEADLRDVMSKRIKVEQRLWDYVNDLLEVRGVEAE